MLGLLSLGFLCAKNRPARVTLARATRREAWTKWDGTDERSMIKCVDDVDLHLIGLRRLLQSDPITYRQKKLPADRSALLSPSEDKMSYSANSNHNPNRLVFGVSSSYSSGSHLPSSPSLEQWESPLSLYFILHPWVSLLYLSLLRPVGVLPLPLPL